MPPLTGDDLRLSQRMRPESGWHKVYDFIFKSDKRCYFFVVNQLPKKLGGKKPIKKKSKLPRENRGVLKNKFMALMDRLDQTSLMSHRFNKS